MTLEDARSCTLAVCVGRIFLVQIWGTRLLCWAVLYMFGGRCWLTECELENRFLRGRVCEFRNYLWHADWVEIRSLSSNLRVNVLYLYLGRA